MNYTHQTALMRIQTNVNFAELIVASPMMLVNPTFKRVEFLSMKTGTLFVARFKTNGTRRQFVRIIKVLDQTEYKASVASFINEYRGTMVIEAERTLSSIKRNISRLSSASLEHSKFGKRLSSYVSDITDFRDVLNKKESESDESLILSGNPKTSIKEEEEPIAKEYASGWINGVFFEGSIKMAFETAVELTKNDLPVNILMTGPSGYGKTSLPLAFAKLHDMVPFRMNCPIVRDSEEFFGYREARAGDTVFIKSEFTNIIETGNAIVVLDELNRLESWLHNLLFPLLDDDRKTTVHGEKIVVGPNVVFVATINEGFQYTGTFEMDQALRNRMDMTIHVGAMPPAKETKLLMHRIGMEKPTAIKIVKIMREIRKLVDAGEIDIDASTRTTIKFGKLVKGGMNFANAVKFTITNGLDNSQGKQVSDKIGKFLM